MNDSLIVGILYGSSTNRLKIENILVSGGRCAHKGRREQRLSYVRVSAENLVYPKMSEKQRHLPEQNNSMSAYPKSHEWWWDETGMYPL